MADQQTFTLTPRPDGRNWDCVSSAGETVTLTESTVKGWLFNAMRNGVGLRRPDGSAVTARTVHIVVTMEEV